MGKVLQELEKHDSKYSIEGIIEFVKNLYLSPRRELCFYKYDDYAVPTLEEVLKMKVREFSQTGCCNTGHKDAFIFYNDSIEGKQHKLKTILHEIGHASLTNYRTLKKMDEPDWAEDKWRVHEWEADLFANMALFVLNGALANMDDYNVMMTQYEKNAELNAERKEPMRESEEKAKLCKVKAVS